MGAADALPCAGEPTLVREMQYNQNKHVVVMPDTVVLTPWLHMCNYFTDSRCMLLHFLLMPTSAIAT